MNGPTIGILAGEASGDNLGVGLMRELKEAWDAIAPEVDAA